MKKIRTIKLIIGSGLLFLIGTSAHSCRTQCYVPASVNSNNVRYLGNDSDSVSSVKENRETPSEKTDSVQAE